MARPNARYFEYRKNLLGVGSAPTPIKVKVANSTTLKVGQAVRINTSGFAVDAGVGAAIAGIVQGLVDEKYIPVNSFNYTGDTGHTKVDDDTVTTASNNQTRTKAVFAEIIVPLEAILFYNDADEDLAQTNLFQLFDLVSTSDQVDTSTNSDTSGQVQLIELDPDGDGDASKGLFRIAESQLLGYHGNATAVLAA
jgi:hypothetical protein